MRKSLIALAMLLQFSVPAPAQVSFGFGYQTENVSISLSTFPELVRVPGYPVYYAADLNSNYFFYDGMYWIFEAERWYSSAWYNGPWQAVDPESMPLNLLRVPVRYYRRPPAFFAGWRAASPPRWGDHWGHDWTRQRSGWDRWNRRAMPAPAPLPTYQGRYTGDRYPSREEQPLLQQRNYRHTARDPLVRQQSARPAPTIERPEPERHDRVAPPPGRNAEPPAPASGRDMPADTRPWPPQQTPERREQRQLPAAPRAAAPPRQEAPAEREAQRRQPASHPEQQRNREDAGGGREHSR